MEENKKKCLSCVDCGVKNCMTRQAQYPEFCPTAALTEEEIEAVVKLYTDNEENKKVAIAGAEVEGEFYRKATRVEEIIHFAHKIGAKKIGIATCVGLLEESRIFARILRDNGFEVYGICCKVSSYKKVDIGVDEKYTCVTGPIMCNPILQAQLLNKEKVDLNVVVGLCVGHDSLFYKYAEGLTTTLITKDRVLGHNPAAALYQSRAYYKHLLLEPIIKQEEGEEKVEE